MFTFSPRGLIENVPVSEFLTNLDKYGTAEHEYFLEAAYSMNERQKRKYTSLDDRVYGGGGGKSVSTCGELASSDMMGNDKYNEPMSG